MRVDDVPNEPAGRLRSVLAVLRNVGGNQTLSEVWADAAQDIAPERGDAISVRAEMASLYHDVEKSIRAMPIQEDRDAYWAYRESWARPILGLGMNDNPNTRMSGEHLVSPEALRTLTMLSGVLRSEAPEASPRLSEDELQEGLAELQETLLRLHAEIGAARWFNHQARARLLDLVTVALDNIVFVNFRGYGSLERSVLTIEGELVSSKAILERTDGPALELARTQWLEAVDSWLRKVSPMVSRVRGMIEYDVVPFAIGASVGWTTRDVTAALGAWIGGRVALEGAHPAPQLTSAQQTNQDSGGERTPSPPNRGGGASDS